MKTSITSVLTRRHVTGSALAAVAAVGAWTWQRGASRGVGGPFALSDGRGNTVRDTDFRGRILIVYFGYASCPDVCPTALAKLAGVIDRLGLAQDREPAVLFISVDPQRDQGARLAEYGKAFRANVTAVTGTRAELDAVAAAYGARYEFAGDTSRDDYAVDHTSIFYVMGPDGTFRTQFPHTASPDAMLSKLQAAMK